MPAKTTTTCPPAIDLDRLVHGRLTEARAAAISEHVGTCSGCQKRLDSMAGGTEELAANLRECMKDTPPSDSAYYKALAASEEEVRATSAFLNGVAEDLDLAPGELKLDFLQPTDEPGRLGRLGTFSIIRIVGRGGMGVVLHAYDPCLARDVAVKVIDPQWANNEVARQRFCREARAAAAVTHDNLVAVHQVDEDEASGLPYLVMQLVIGESLDQRLKRVGKLGPMEVARLGMQAAAGLAAAHASGLIHRDIKPGNILLEASSDRVKLTDFGLARAAEDVKLTRTGFVAGSPLYMAPEQARGDEVDHRADLFSLGSVLYEAATGAAPFEGKTPLAVLRRVADETPKPLSSVNPDVPWWLSDIIDKLLAKNPADRYQTASEVAEAFEEELARERALSVIDAPVDACGSTSRSGNSRRPRKHICWKSVALRVLPWVGGALAGSLLVGLLRSPSPPAINETVQTPSAVSPVAETGPAPKATLKGDSGTVWAVAFMGNDDLVVGMDDGSVRIWNWRNGSIRKALVPQQGGTVWSADVSGDGKYLVTSCDDSTVSVWETPEFNRAKTSFSTRASTKAAAFNPANSDEVATGDRNGTIRLCAIAGGGGIPIYGQRGIVHALAYSPNGKKLASAGSDGIARVWDLDDTFNLEKVTAAPMKLDQHKGAVYGVAFSPDGLKIATTGWDGTMRIWDAETGEQLKTIKAFEGDSWSVCFGGDGKWVAVAGGEGVKVWEVETGKEIFAFHGTRPFHTVRFAKDGTTLAAGGRDGNVRVWEIGK